MKLKTDDALENYVYEIQGNIEVKGEQVAVYLEALIKGYDEDDASQEFTQDLTMYLIDGYRRGEIIGDYAAETVEELEGNLSYYLGSAYAKGNIILTRQGLM